MFSGNSCSKATVPCLDILLWTFCFQILLLLVYSCHLTYTYKKYSVTRMVHKIIKMNNKLSGEEEGRAIQCHGPTLSGKGWQGVGRDKGPDCNPHVTQCSLRLCRPTPKGSSCSTCGTHSVALQAGNTSPSLPDSGPDPGTWLLQPHCLHLGRINGDDTTCS